MEALSALRCKCLKCIRESMVRLSLELSATRTIREHTEDHYRLLHPTIARVPPRIREVPCHLANFIV